MTVSSTTTKASYSGNGSTTVFAVPFYFLQNADLLVILRSSAGVETTQVLGTNYSVTGAGNENGGSLTMTVAPPTGTTLTILRNAAATQETDLLPNDRLPAESLETALDKLTMLVQQLDEESARYLKVALTDSTAGTTLPTSSSRANKFLFFDNNGNPIVVGATDAYTVSEEVKIATQGQTVFTLTTMSYIPGINNLSVFVDGVNQYRGTAYTETSSTVVTFSQGLHAGAVVKFSTVRTLSSDDPGANNVMFTQAGTGAVPRSVQSKERDIVSVKDFGAQGDGVTDDTAAIQAAIDFIATTGGELVFPPGTYKILSQISKTFADGISVSIRGYGAKIDATNAVTPNAVLVLSGSRASSTALGATVFANSDTFTVASASGISAGKFLLITSTDLWNPTRPYYYKGEIVLAEKVVGTTITSAVPLYDGYTAATTTVHILNMPQITLEGLEIECNSDVTALQMYYCRNPVVRNCEIHGSRYAGMDVGYSFGGVIDSNLVYDVWNGLVTGTSYGISVGSGQGCKVTNNTVYSARHSIASGGFEPTRELVIANNVLHNSTLEDLTGSIDVHGNAELVVVSSNVASSITCGGINCTFSNNILKSAETNVAGILIFQEINSSSYLIQNNQISCAGATAIGIAVNPTQPNLNIQRLDISNNDIVCVSNSVRIEPRNVSSTGCSITSLAVKGNRLKTTGGTVSFVFGNTGVATYSINELLSSNNVYESTTHDAFVMSDTNSATITKSVGDVFKGNRLNGYLAYFTGTNVALQSPAFYGNTGGAGASRSVYYGNSGRVDVANPIFSNVTYKAELGTPTTYAENGWYAATPTILNSSGAKLINFYGTLGRAITYGTAAPVAGAWSVGDRVYNQTPAIGQPKSWVCTVAGTPGTWQSEGNL